MSTKEELNLAYELIEAAAEEECVWINDYRFELVDDEFEIVKNFCVLGYLKVKDAKKAVKQIVTSGKLTMALT